MTKQMSQMKVREYSSRPKQTDGIPIPQQTRLQQLENEVLRRRALEAVDAGVDSGVDLLSDTVPMSQQDAVKLLRQMVADARHQTREEREIASAERAVLGDVIRELDEEISKIASDNRMLSTAVAKQQEKLQKMQGELSQAQIERLMIENDNVMIAAGRLANKALSKLKI